MNRGGDWRSRRQNKKKTRRTQERRLCWVSTKYCVNPAWKEMKRDEKRWDRRREKAMKADCFDSMFYGVSNWFLSLSCPSWSQHEQEQETEKEKERKEHLDLIFLRVTSVLFSLCFLCPSSLFSLIVEDSSLCWQVILVLNCLWNLCQPNGRAEKRE